MSRIAHKPRLAVVSPFLDKRHGTERRVVEWVSRLAETFEIHVYSQRVQDLDLTKVVWHRIPKFPGPHILNFLWWFLANRLRREWDCRFRGLRPDLVLSPGINCLDADVVSVHVVFAEYSRRAGPDARLSQQPVRNWPRILHRQLYYSLVALFERRVYTRPDLTLILIARRTADSLRRYYGCDERFPVLYMGVDHNIFNLARRVSLREGARMGLGISADHFTLLLIGNDWRNKGLPVLVEAMASLPGLPIHLLVIGTDDPAAFRSAVEDRGLQTRVRFLPPRQDVEFYYAAADAYVGPSLEDTFAQPPVEAMACGLPVIVSSTNGASEVITNGSDGLILEDPTDAGTLATLIRRLYEDEDFRARLGRSGAENARQYTWERNARDLTAILEEILRRKARLAEHTLAQES
ncbi:MAG TPA: glycosyltransferase family 4 protein [archaeon]|nr:glycosyltransferase family 4 protein [archaeon]